MLANVNSPSPLPLHISPWLAQLVPWQAAQLSPFMRSSVSAGTATFRPNWSLSPQIGRRPGPRETERADFGGTSEELVATLLAPALMIIVSDSTLDWAQAADLIDSREAEEG